MRVRPVLLQEDSCWRWCGIILRHPGRTYGHSVLASLSFQKVCVLREFKAERYETPLPVGHERFMHDFISLGYGQNRHALRIQKIEFSPLSSLSFFAKQRECRLLLKLILKLNKITWVKSPKFQIFYFHVRRTNRSTLMVSARPYWQLDFNAKDLMYSYSSLLAPSW